MHGMETVALTARQVKPIEVAELRKVRWALGVTREDRIRNEYTRGKAKIANVGDKLMEARLRWLWTRDEKRGRVFGEAYVGNDSTWEKKKRKAMQKVDGKHEERWSDG